MQYKKLLTKKQLVIITKCPPYTIDYLYRCNRLSVASKSKGAGYPILFHKDCIKIINNHLDKQKR